VAKVQEKEMRFLSINSAILALGVAGALCLPSQADAKASDPIGDIIRTHESGQVIKYHSRPTKTVSKLAYVEVMRIALAAQAAAEDFRRAENEVRRPTVAMAFADFSR
jgi:hypothetical protein